ncbi:2OG-Fe(II) oxygenase family protein [Candidatus Pelagibacter sp.]|nr:2OG-Fe(II) oxygenase family protein [Candidatus Pelagibacter sp.]
MKIQSPFGPKIAIIKIPKKIVMKINNEVDNILKDKSKIKKSDYSKKLVGEVKQELELSKNFVNKYLIKFLKINIKNFIKQSSKKNIKNIQLKNLWVVRQFKNEYNPIHYHSGSISGVGYLKMPKNLNKGKKKSKTNGTIDFIHGSRSLLNKSIFNHKPKVGDMIIFPNYLMHTAYPFNVDGERRSFSFNLEIDKKTLEKINE